LPKVNEKLKRFLRLCLVVPLVIASLAFPAAAVNASASPSARWIGFYVPGAPLDPSPLTTLNSKAGEKATVSEYFQNTSQGFTFTQATNAVAAGAVPLVTLEFWDPANGIDQPSFSYAKISGGSFDTYLHSYAKAARAFGSPVWLRPLHEMNGNWYPWGGTVNGNTPAGFVAAWRHIHDIFVAEGATNVSFVWCPNADSVPDTAANSISAYWPGDAYVDYAGIDGYNFGGSSWRSFSSIFSAAYAKVTSLSSKPVIVGEIGCSSVGGDKAAWITDMFKVIPSSFPRIAGVSWFDADKGNDWRIESDSASLAAFSAGAATWQADTRTGSPQTPTASGVTIATSALSVRMPVPFVLSGVLTPSLAGGIVAVSVQKPGTIRWSYSSARSTYGSSGTVGTLWWYRYTPKVRGLYHFSAAFSGDTSRSPSMSRTIAVGVR
jgi:hypothetical protein